jgi:hypothetical protein
MSQTLASLLGTATAKAGNAKKEEEREKTFHEKELDKMREDPANQKLVQAKAIAKASADSFMKSCTDTQDRNHKDNFMQFKNEFELDVKKVDEHFLNKICSEMNAREYEKKDPNYEANLKRKYKPVGITAPMQMTIYSNFCADLDDKHARVGYKGDAKFCKNYCETYGLAPNDNIIDLRNIVPKD